MKRKCTLFALAAVPFVACSDEAGDDDDQDLDTPASFVLRIDNVAPWTMLKSGTQTTKTDGTQGPIGPGESYDVVFTANKGQAISFATMLGESNDWFFAPGPAGIPLFTPDGVPMTGDVTQYVKLWDAGTEIDQEPGVGDATAPKQPSPNYGAEDPNRLVREVPRITTLTDGSPFTLPVTSDMIRVTLTQLGETEWKLHIKATSTATTLMTSQGPMPVHLSPFAWSLHIMPAPLFTPGQPDRGQGLEKIAEDGPPDELGRSLTTLSGFHTPLSPGVVVVHRSAEPLYTVGAIDRGRGLERIAEDGDPAELARNLTADASLAVVAFDTPVGKSAPGPAMPGEAYEVTFQAVPGVDRLSFATMFGMSNDWFFASQDVIVDAATLTIALYDLGSEIDQEPAIGPFTAPQQHAPNTGPVDETRTVRAAQYAVPTSQHLRVTLERQ
jgi:hypothetical protein